jgi:ankyrin repeat protein
LAAAVAAIAAVSFAVDWAALSPASAQSSKADVNARRADGTTSLMYAVHNGDAKEVERLLEAGADVAVVSNYGVSAMTLAGDVADPVILKLLLDAGADVNAANPEGQTALMSVARTGNVEAAKLLLDRGATIDARERFGGQTALMWAAARRHPPMIDFLVERGADINARSTVRDYQRHVTAEGRPKSLDSGGFTPLLYAARENCRECVRVLLARGADINLPDPDGVTPLHLAIVNTNWDIAKQLIDAGADVNQWDIYGQGPLFTILGNYTRQDTSKGPLDPPNATNGRAVLDLLLAKGANPNMQLFFRPAGVRGPTNWRGSTPLIRAANAGDVEMVDLLLAHGADATLTTADRQTVIHAVITGRAQERVAMDLVAKFYAAGADVNSVALVNHIEEVRGGSALHYAVRKRQREMIRLLAFIGIDMNAKDQDGLTALDYTQSRGFMPFMALQTPLFDQEAALLRQLGATELMAKAPEWPVLGPPQGVWPDIWPVGEPSVHAPVYTHVANR